ncbi:MAG: hypothetical protein SGBAC_010967 [Bacillariaceae sp.]
MARKKEPTSKRRRPNEVIPENVSSISNDVPTAVTPIIPSEEQADSVGSGGSENVTSMSDDVPTTTTTTVARIRPSEEAEAVVALSVHDGDGGGGSVTEAETTATPRTIDEEELDEEGTEAEEEETVVKLVLQDLRFANSPEDSIEAMDTLFQVLHEDYDLQETLPLSYFHTDNISASVANSITECNGVFAIMMALANNEGDDCLFKGVRLLHLVAKLAPAGGQQLIESGAIRSLLTMIAKEEKKYIEEEFDHLDIEGYDKFLKSNMIGLLSELVGGLDWRICKETATEETLDFVIAAMKKYPDDEVMQEVGIDYLLKVGTTGDSEVVKMLQARKVGHLFLDALEQFRDESDDDHDDDDNCDDEKDDDHDDHDDEDDEDVFKIAKKAMAWYTSLF